MAAVALALVSLGSSLSTPVLVGVLSLAMAGLTGFEGPAAERGKNGEAEA